MKHKVSSFISMIIVSCLGLSSYSPVMLAGTASTTFNFSAVFVGGGCEINAPSSIKFNDGNDLFAADIEQGGAKTTQKFDLTLNDCNGWGLTPTIKVSGETTHDFGSAPLFRDNGLGLMDSNGYGVLLQTVGNPSFNSNDNLAANGAISNKDWSTESQLNSIHTTLPMVAILTCGNCDYEGRQGGQFKATVTFDFVYE